MIIYEDEDGKLMPCVTCKNLFFLSHVCHWQLHYDGSVTRGWRICVGTRETMTFFNGKLWISLTLDGAQGTVHKGTGNPDIKYHCHSVNWWFELIWASVHMTTSDTHPRSVIPSCCALKHTLYSYNRGHGICHLNIGGTCVGWQPQRALRLWAT